MLPPANLVNSCDYRIARKLSSPAIDHKTASGTDWTFAGTPSYMAPEVILSYHFDERADQFSLGTVFYEMLTGTNPFAAGNIGATAARVVNDQAPPVAEKNPEAGPAIDRLVMRLLAKDPQERYEKTNDLVAELEKLQQPQVAWTKYLIAVLVVLLLALPSAFLYRSTIEGWMGITPLPEKKILAVLPFRVLGEDRGERLYSDGAAEILTANLAEFPLTIPNLQVVSASEIRDRSVDTADKARAEFGATLVLAGTFQFSGDIVRVSYSLPDPAIHRVLRAVSK